MTVRTPEALLARRIYLPGPLTRATRMNPLTIQQFGTLSVRTIGGVDTPWFVAADVAEALEYRDAANMTRLLADDEKGAHIVSTPGGDQQMTIINEPGLYRAIFSSRSSKAEPFRRWVFHEVLPAIRQTGGYTLADMTEHGQLVSARTSWDHCQRHNRAIKAKDAQIQALEDQMAELLRD